MRDASHQLRTPLAVLKAQVQSAQRGDVSHPGAAGDRRPRSARATELANQMLALKVEQLRQQGEAPVVDWAGAAPGAGPAHLIAERGSTSTGDAEPARVRAYEWSLRELAQPAAQRGQAHPAGGPDDRPSALTVTGPLLTVRDGGAGVGDEQRQRLFQPLCRR